MGGKIIALSTPLWHTVLALFVGVALLFCLAVTTPKDTKITDDQNGKPTSRADQNMRGNETIEKSNSHNKRGTGSIGDLFSEKELQKIRWQISWLNNWCGAYKSKNRGMCRQPRNWKGNCLNGRCKFHSGKNVHGPISKQGRRNQMLSRLTSGEKSKLSKDVFNQDELVLYQEAFDYLKGNYDISDVGADQLAILFVYQKCYLIPKLQDGMAVDLVPVSEMIRRWCNELKLTPKSREGFEVSPTLLWGAAVERLYRQQEEEKKKQEQNKGDNGL
jgi:hypothetical protein